MSQDEGTDYRADTLADVVLAMNKENAELRAERDWLRAEVQRLKTALMRLHETFPGPMVLPERKP